MRKSKIPNQLQQLAEPDLALLHSWFPKFGYHQIAGKLREQFQIDICESQLCRYYQRLQQTELLNDGAEKPLTVPALVALQNGAPLPPDAPDPSIIKRQCIKAAARPDLKSSDLLHLMQVFTYDERRAQAERRLDIATRLNDLRDRQQKIRASRAEQAKTRVASAVMPVPKSDREP